MKYALIVTTIVISMAMNVSFADWERPLALVKSVESYTDLTDITNYVDKAAADATNYTDSVANTIRTDTASTYETQAHASATYETKTNASTTYLTLDSNNTIQKGGYDWQKIVIGNEYPEDTSSTLTLNPNSSYKVEIVAHSGGYAPFDAYAFKSKYVRFGGDIIGNLDQGIIEVWRDGDWTNIFTMADSTYLTTDSNGTIKKNNKIVPLLVIGNDEVSQNGGTLILEPGMGGGTIIAKGGPMGKASINLTTMFNEHAFETDPPDPEYQINGTNILDLAKADATALINPSNETFSNAVLAVGLNIDPNSVAVLNQIAQGLGDFPIEGTATTVGGILAALAGAIAWLKRNKVGNDELPAAVNAIIESRPYLEKGAEGGVYVVIPD